MGVPHSLGNLPWGYQVWGGGGGGQIKSPVAPGGPF